jgi:hypothetical protein
MSRVEAIMVIAGNFTRRDLLGRKDSGQLKEYRRVVQALEVLGLSEVEKQEAELAMGYRSAATGGLCLWLQNAIAAKGKPRAGGAEAVKE